MPTLSEHDSKALVSSFGIPVAPEHLVTTAGDAATAAAALGFPVAVKLCGGAIAHKTERGLVRLGLPDAEAVRRAAGELLAAARPDDAVTGVLVAPMVQGTRELIAGLVTDAQFGPVVMVGVGGVLAEALGDVTFRLVPITDVDAAEMIDDLASQALLGAVRGEPPLDRSALADVLLGLSALATGHPEVVSVDLNPLIVHDGRPVAVDALVEIA